MKFVKKIIEKFAIFGFILSFVLMLGIVGGIENGQPIENIWWCVPCLIFSFVSAKFANK